MRPGDGECPLVAVWSRRGGGGPGSGSNIAAWGCNIAAWGWTAAQTAKWRASEQVSWLPCSVRLGPGTPPRRPVWEQTSLYRVRQKMTAGNSKTGGQWRLLTSSLLSLWRKTQQVPKGV